MWNSLKMCANFSNFIFFLLVSLFNPSKILPSVSISLKNSSKTLLSTSRAMENMFQLERVVAWWFTTIEMLTATRTAIRMRRAWTIWWRKLSRLPKILKIWSECKKYQKIHRKHCQISTWWGNFLKLSTTNKIDE